MRLGRKPLRLYTAVGRGAPPGKAVWRGRAGGHRTHPAAAAGPGRRRSRCSRRGRHSRSTWAGALFAALHFLCRSGGRLGLAACGLLCAPSGVPARFLPSALPCCMLHAAMAAAQQALAGSWPPHAMLQSQLCQVLSMLLPPLHCFKGSRLAPAGCHLEPFADGAPQR